MSRSRSWWLGFWVFTSLLLAGLIGISGGTLLLEDANRLARAEAHQRDQVRDTLWTLDGWLNPILGTEAERPPDERWFQPLPGDTCGSPLLKEVPLFPYRFEVEPGGASRIEPTVPNEAANLLNLPQ